MPHFRPLYCLPAIYRYGSDALTSILIVSVEIDSYDHEDNDKVLWLKVLLYIHVSLYDNTWVIKYKPFYYHYEARVYGGRNSTLS